MSTKIYINGELFGYCEDPISFTQEMREKRRNSEISHQMNIAYYENTDEIYIFTDSGRPRRPLIIVKEGIPLLREEHLNELDCGLIEWDDLINNGIIEFLDAEEEENSYIAISLAELNEEHTHLEIDSSTMLGICAGIIPFSNHNASPRNTIGAGMAKQALGLYVSNYKMRMDNSAHLLHNPQTPIVKTRIIDSINYDLSPSGQNFVVALMSYEGYNMEDAIVINKSALERGLGRSSFFRAYGDLEERYAFGGVDKFEVPDKNINGYRSEEAYRNLDEDGIANPESYVVSGDVLIGKTSPPKFFEGDLGTVADRRRETSVTVRYGEKGIVDEVLLSETSEGLKLVKIRVRDTRQPEFGDKFASRHGQKGVIGLIVPPEDMPFSEFGVVPDLIINPHAIPSRMPIGQVLEMVAGKAGCLEGERIDATPFNQALENEIKQELVNHGFESAGCESLYSGVTGERINSEIFVGVSYYQKLNHMTTDKITARSRGPVQVLTHQPTEGRLREGGLRFGDFERDCLIAHGAAITLKERLLDDSDKYEAIVCENCGMLGVYDRNKNKKYCPICGDVETYPIEISYTFKLFLDELKSMCIFPKLVLGDKLGSKKQFKKKHYTPIKPLEKNRNVISGIRLSDEEPIPVETKNEEKVTECIICGKKLNKYQKNLCKTCSRKQYASRIIKKLTSVVKPGVTFKKRDLKSLNLDDIQIQDYIWTLQEFSLIDVDINKFKLKGGDILNNFRIETKMDPIDFNKINEEHRLDKTCKTCGKNLPISQFYKTSEGYEDNCKNCKRLIITAKYLEDIINYFGFGREFNKNDLKKYIPNKNQLDGIIWSLQDVDLLIEKKNNTFVLVDKSICLKFLEKYNINSKLFIKKSEDKKKSKSNRTKSKSNTKTSSSKSKVTKSQSHKSNSKTSKPNHKRSKKTNVKFNSLNDDENTKFDLTLELFERKKFEFILKLLRQGKSKSEVAKVSEIKVSIIDNWYNQGKNKYSENTIYFYNEMNKIKKSNKKKKSKSNSAKSKSNTTVGSSKSKVTKSQSHKSNFKTSNPKTKRGLGKSNILSNSLNYYEDKKVKNNNLVNVSKNPKKRSIDKNNKIKSTSNVKSSESNNLKDERQLMDEVLSLMRKGYSRIKASKEAGIKIGQIVIWYSQGRENYSENSIYFYNQLNLIEKK